MQQKAEYDNFLILVGFKAVGLSCENRGRLWASLGTKPQWCFLTRPNNDQKMQQKAEYDNLLILVGFKAVGLSCENRGPLWASLGTKPQWCFLDRAKKQQKY